MREKYKSRGNNGRPCIYIIKICIRHNLPWTCKAQCVLCSEVLLYIFLVGGSYKQWTRGPGDSRTRGPEDQGPEDPTTEGCFALQQLPIAKIQLYSQSLPMLQAQTHGYVLFIITKGVTFNKQCYFKLFSEFFDASLLSVLQSHIPVKTVMHVTFDPGA